MLLQVRNFSLEKTLHSGQIFNYSFANGFWYVLHKGKIFKLKQTAGQLEFYTWPILDDVEAVKNFFSLDSADYFSPDSVLQKASDYSAGIRILRQDPYACTFCFILSQFSSIPRIKRNVSELSAAFGEKVEFDSLHFRFIPSANKIANLSVSNLRRFKLGYRAKYLIESCRLISDGLFDFDSIMELNYKAAKRKIMELPGVGEKVADCILLFSMGFKEAFPVDTWIRKIMKKHYKLRKATDKRIADYARRKFGEQAGLAQQLLYASREELV